MEPMKNTDKGCETKTIVAVLASGFFITLGVALFTFVVPLASLDEKVSGLWIGSGFAGFFLTRLLSGPLGGLLADKRGPRTPLLWGFGIGGFLPLVYLANPSIFALYCMQFVLGGVAGLVRPVGLAILGTRSENGSRVFSLYTLLFNLAVFLGPLLAGFLYWDRSIEPILVGLALCMVLAHLLVFAFVPNTVSTLAKSSLPRQQQGGMRFYGLLFAIFGRTFGIGLLMSFYPILLSLRLGADNKVIGGLFALIGLTTCLTLPLGDWLKKRVGHDPITIGMLISGAGLVGSGVGIELWHFIIAGVTMGFGAAMSIPAAMAEASRAMSHQGRVFGATHVATGAGFLLGPLFGGVMVQISGDVGLAFFIAGLVGWGCLSVWCQYRQSGQERHPNPSVVIVILLVGLTGAWLISGRDWKRQDELYRYSDVAMGTVVNLTLEAGSQKAADDAAKKAILFMRNLQQDFDHRSIDGSVGHINRAAGKSWVKPTKRTFELLRRTLLFSQLTNGLFDPTVGAATTSPLYFALDASLLAAKKHLVDYRLVLLDENNGRVRLLKSGMALDLGGVAKGTIIDATVALLRKHGIQAGVVEAGGDFYCFGDREWTVGVRHPRGEQVYATLNLREKGVCGSGDYEQFVLGHQGGNSKMLHHILDPGKMSPAENSLGVTVIASSAEQADRLATALFIMGSEKGKEFLAMHWPEDAAMWFDPELSVVTTDNFQ